MPPPPVPASLPFTLPEDQASQEAILQPWPLKEDSHGARGGQIRITFTSHSVRSLEKLGADQWRKGKESQSERTCSDAYQDSENNYKENSLW